MNFTKIPQNIFFTEQLRATASVLLKKEVDDWTIISSLFIEVVEEYIDVVEVIC